MVWHAEETRADVGTELARIGRDVREAVPAARLADDQLFRLTSLAFRQPEEEADRAAIVTALPRAGADVTVNNLWVLGWLGGYEKLAATRRVMTEIYGVDIEEEPDAFLHTGDSTNDAPMFAFFRHTVGVSTVRRYIEDIPVPPRWITDGPGGDGFVEAAEAVMGHRALQRAHR